MIEVTQLTKQYGSQTAVDNVSFTVPDGQITAFLGNNGAGKSTTMRMILGLDTPTSGISTIDGVPYTEITHPLKTVGSLLDASAVNPKRTAKDHLKINATATGLPGDNIDDLLELVGLAHVNRKPVGQFSLGMRQRLGIATALLGDPTHIILDEPTNGLDPDAIKWLRGLIQEMSQDGKSILMSSHQLQEVASVADKVVIIEQGRLIHTSTMDELHKQYNSTTTKVLSDNQEHLVSLLAAAGATIEENTAEGAAVSGITPQTIGRIALENNITLHALIPQERSLEDIFFHILTPPHG